MSKKKKPKKEKYKFKLSDFAGRTIENIRSVNGEIHIFFQGDNAGYLKFIPPYYDEVASIHVVWNTEMPVQQTEIVEEKVDCS